MRLLLKHWLEKKICISGHWIVFTAIRGCLTANFFIYNRVVNNLLEDVALKPLFRCISNVVLLFLGTRGNLFAFENCEKLCCFSMLFQKKISSVKTPKNIPFGCIFFCQTQWNNIKFDIEVSDICGPVIWGMRISESISNLSQVVLSCPLFTQLKSSHCRN